MKRITSICLIIVLFIVLLLAGIVGCTKKVITSLSIMSFNIRCIAVEENDANIWKNRKQEVIDVINKYQPDLIGFQEITIPQYEFMEDNLSDMYGNYAVFRSKSEFFNECAAIFYKKNRFTVQDEETFWLSETPDVLSKGWDAYIERVCSKLTLLDKNTNKVFNHYNTHFDHEGAVAKEQSVYLLLEKVKSSNLPSVVTGDFNIHEQSPNYNRLVSETLQDTKFLSPEEFSDLGVTYNGFGKYEEGLPIDFILVTEGDFVTQSYSIIRDADDEGNYPSDHFPIISVLQQN